MKPAPQGSLGASWQGLLVELKLPAPPPLRAQKRSVLPRALGVLLTDGAVRGRLKTGSS